MLFVLFGRFKSDNYIFDEKSTAILIKQITRSDVIKKIFIEPHLKTRLYLKSNKIRFHGCHAVRHDDQIHIQM